MIVSGDFTKRPWHGPRGNCVYQSMFIILRIHSYYSFIWVFCLHSCLLLSKSISISAQVHRGHYATLMPSPFRFMVPQCSRELPSGTVVLKPPDSPERKSSKFKCWAACKNKSCLASSLHIRGWGVVGLERWQESQLPFHLLFLAEWGWDLGHFLDPQISKLSDGWQWGFYWTTVWFFSLPKTFYTLYFIGDHSISQDSCRQTPHFCSLDDLCPQSTLQSENRDINHCWCIFRKTSWRPPHQLLPCCTPASFLFRYLLSFLSRLVFLTADTSSALNETFANKVVSPLPIRGVGGVSS